MYYLELAKSQIIKSYASLSVSHPCTIFIHIKLRLIYMQGLKYMLDNAAEFYEWNKPLGPFKHQVSKLLILTNIKMI